MSVADIPEGSPVAVRQLVLTTNVSSGWRVFWTAFWKQRIAGSLWNGPSSPFIEVLAARFYFFANIRVPALPMYRLHIVVTPRKDEPCGGRHAGRAFFSMPGQPAAAPHSSRNGWWATVEWNTLHRLPSLQLKG